MRRFSIKHSITILALAVLAALGASGAYAEGTSKIGFVDVEQVTKKATFISGMLKSIEATMGDREKALQKKEDEYMKLQTQIERKSAVATETEVDAMRKQAKELGSQIDEEKDALNRTLEKARKEQMEPALDRILEVTKTIGKEEKFDIILRGDMILFGSEAADITQKVIDRLNAEGPGAAKPAADVKAETDKKETSTEKVTPDTKEATDEEVAATPTATPAAKSKATTKSKRTRRRAPKTSTE